jgi:hypothetical protein
MAISSDGDVQPPRSTKKNHRVAGPGGATRPGSCAAKQKQGTSATNAHAYMGVQSPLDNSAAYDLCILDRITVRAQLSISPFHRNDFGREPFVLSVLDRIMAKHELSRGHCTHGLAAT